MAYIKKNLALEKMRRKLGKENDIEYSGAITVEQSIELGRLKKKLDPTKEEETSSIHTDSSYES